MGGTFVNKDFDSLEELLGFLEATAKMAREAGLYLQSAYIDCLADATRYNLRAYFSK